MSYEVELLVLAVLFYLYDSSALLYSNEAIMTCDRGQRWSAITGWTGFMFFGRSLCMLNPFTPHRPSFRLHWNLDRLDTEGELPPWAAYAEALKTLAPMNLAAGIALFIILPLGLLTALGAYAIVPALVLLYGSTVIALFQLRRLRVPVAVGRKGFWGFAFECLACPPFAVNMVRRITLLDRISEPLPLAAARLLDGDRWAILRKHCISRLDEAMLRVAEDSNELKSMQAQKQRLSTLV